MRSKILFICYYSIGIGGIERKIADLCQYVSRHGDFDDLTVYLVLDKQLSLEGDEAVFLDIVNSSSVITLYKPQGEILGRRFPFALYLIWTILRLRPTVVLAFLRRTAVVCLFARCLVWWRRMRVVVSEDTFPSAPLTFEVTSRLQRSVISHFIRTWYPRAHAVAVPTEAARRDLVGEFAVPPEKITVIKNWVLNKPQSGPASPDFDLIFVGRVEPEKNLALFVRIVGEVRRALGDVRACVVGGGTETERVMALAQQLGLDAAISFAGYQKEVDEYLRRSRVFCLTSHYEGLSVAGLEAMACGLPIVSTAYAGAEELVQEGRTGYICGTESEYVSRVLTLLGSDSLRAVMGQGAQRRVQRYHGEENLARLLKVLLD